MASFKSSLFRVDILLLYAYGKPIIPTTMYMNGTLLSIIVLHIPGLCILSGKKILVKSIVSPKLLYLQNSMAGLRKGVMSEEKEQRKGKLYVGIVDKMDIIGVAAGMLLEGSLKSVVF